MKIEHFLKELKEKQSTRIFVSVSIGFVITLVFLTCRYVRINKAYKDTSSSSSVSTGEFMVTTDDVEINEDVGVSAWLKDYLAYDFDTCDQLVNPNTFRFNNYVYEHGIVAHQQMYVLLQGKAVDAIDVIDVYDVKHEDDKNIYSVRVSCKQYNLPDKIVFDEDAYSKVCSDFIEGRLVEEEFEDELTKLYLQWLSDCYTFNTDETVTFECQLIDYTAENTGLLEVDDVTDFVTRVLAETRALKVEQIYESQLSKLLDDVLKDY